MGFSADSTPGGAGDSVAVTGTGRIDPEPPSRGALAGPLASLFGVAIALCLTLALLTLPLPWAVGNAPLQAALQNIAQVDASVGPRGRDGTSQLVRNYLQSPGTEILDSPGFSFRERKHFQEVKGVLDTIKRGGWWVKVGLLLALAALLGLGRSNPTQIIEVLARSALTTSVFLGLAMLVGLFGLAFGFDLVFVTLHRIVFADDNWVLPSDSLTIALFPGPYFVAAAQAYGLWVSLVTLAAWALAWSLRRLPQAAGGSNVSKDQNR